MPYLNREQIIELIKKKRIYSNKSITKSQLQPASLDLTLSDVCYRIKASFIPNKNNSISFNTFSGRSVCKLAKSEG